MLVQFAIGAAVIAVTVVITAVGSGIAVRVVGQLKHWLARPPFVLKSSLALGAAALFGLALLSIASWAWALVFLGLGVFVELEQSVYFAIVAFTTLGFGDIILPEQWRLLSGICATNGLLLFGLITAFLVELFSRLHRARVIGAEAFE